MENSFQIVKKLNGLVLERDIALISLDAVSLFTNIPIDMTLDSISNRWDYIKNKCSIPKNEFMLAINLFYVRTKNLCFDNVSVFP